MDISLIEKVLNDAGTDALLITSPSNTLYYGIYNNPECAILVTKNNIYYFTDDRYTGEAKEIIPHEFKLVSLSCTDHKTICSYALKDGAKTIGVESVSYNQHLFISEMFEKTVDVHDIVSAPRAVKTEEEISFISTAAHANDVAFENLLPQIKEGMTELELAYLLQLEYIKAGGEGIAFDTISVFGEHTAYPHGHPGHTKLRYGDVVTLDFGTKFNGYCSDITRSFAFGKPADPDYVKIYKAVLEANKIGCDIVRKGMTCFDADKACRDYLQSKDLAKYFTHSLGHGVGIDIHEKPFLSSRSKDVFENNQVYTIEPGVYINGKFGIRIEDILYLKDGQPVTLSRCNKNLIIL